MRLHKREGMPSAEADMTPMIDMTFQLIAFFMVLINFSDAETNERIRLPASQLAKPPDAPLEMLTAPIPSSRAALVKAGLRVDAIDHFEINEAFATVPLAWLKELGADPSRLNPRGGAIALGHPLGASGARLMCTLLHGLEDSGGRYGLQSMCEAGGMANTTVIGCGRQSALAV